MLVAGSIGGGGQQGEDDEGHMVCWPWPPLVTRCYTNLVRFSKQTNQKDLCPTTPTPTWMSQLVKG